jgi:selenocysteine lyase/cysteine desulfurase
MANLDVAALRADTPGCERIVHLNNAGSSLPPNPVVDAMVDHLPVAEIGRHCRERELLYLVDACQSIGQVPLDVAEIGADLLATTGRWARWSRSPWPGGRRSR